MSENVDHLKNAVNKTFDAMKNDENLFNQYKADPLQVLESHGAVLGQLDAAARSGLAEQLSVAPSTSRSQFNFKCEACKTSLGVALAAVGGPSIFIPLETSIQSGPSVTIIEAIAFATGFSTNLVVQILQDVMMLETAPGDLYKKLLKELCHKMKAC